MIQKNRWFCVAVLTGVLMVGGWGSLLLGELKTSLWVGLGLAFVLAVPGFWTLSWSFSKSDRLFYGVFVGGVLGRLSAVALTAFTVYGMATLSFTAVLVSLVLSLFVFSCIELYFLLRQVRLS